MINKRVLSVLTVMVIAVSILLLCINSGFRAVVTDKSLKSLSTDFDELKKEPETSDRRESSEIFPIVTTKSKLPLRLVGTFRQDREQMAYIEDLTSFETGEYQVGDNILGAKLIKILSGKVVFIKNRQRIILTLENHYDWAKPDDWIDTTARDKFVVSKDRLRQKVSNVNGLLNEVIPVPYVSDGKIKGFRISLLKKSGFIAQAGIKKGDIIKAINGQKLDSLKSTLSAYESLRNLVNKEQEPLIEIELQRGKKTRVFTYRILEK
ncbi:MAG: hypothetical protein NG737_07305 [Omnitrophica bacterium]|nr:hypothetical protein [Candidatus Omnitrophota bacterium]